MYICVCYGITDKQITQAMQAGAVSPQAIARELGCGTQCGSCRGDIRQMSRDFQAAQTPPAAPSIELYRPALPLTA